MRSPGSSRAASVFGLVLLASVGSVIINPNNIDFRRFGSPGLNALLFALLFILYGLVLVPTEERLRRAVPDLPVAPQSIWATIVMAAVILALVPAGFMLIGGIMELVSLARGPLDASAIGPLLIVLVVLIVLALRWLLETREKTIRGRGGVRALGYAVLAAPIAVGAVESVRAIGTIVR